MGRPLSCSSRSWSHSSFQSAPVRQQRRCTVFLGEHHHHHHDGVTSALSSSSSSSQEEVDAIGGDPFFLTNDDDDNDDDDDDDQVQVDKLLFLATEEEEDKDLAPTDQNQEATQEEMEVSALTILAEMMALSSTTQPIPTVVAAATKIETTSKEQIEEVYAMGGDPFFLTDEDDDDDDDGNGKDVGTSSRNTVAPGSTDLNERQKEQMEEVYAMGGDPFFLTNDNDDDNDDDGDIDVHNESMSKDHGQERVEKQILATEDLDTDQRTNAREEMNSLLLLQQTLPISPERNEEEISALKILAEMMALSNPSIPAAAVDTTAAGSNVGSTVDNVVDLLDEIESMGGDPFFLISDDEADDHQVVDSRETSSDTSNKSAAEKPIIVISTSKGRYATDGQGPTPQALQAQEDSPSDDANWEWDGIVDENAHFDFI